MKENFGKVVSGVLVAAGLLTVVYRLLKAKKQQRLQVLRPSTERLQNVQDERLIRNLFQMACSVFSGSKLDAHSDEALFEKQAMTLYSLYKQCKEGDADEFDGNKKKTDPNKL